MTIPAAVVVPDLATDEWGRIYSTTRNVLNAYVDYFAAHGVALPTDEDDKVLAFVSDGAVAYDLPLFAIEMIRFAPGTPGKPQMGPIAAATEYTIEATLHLLRWVPTMQQEGPPTAEDQEASAQVLLRDAWLLFQGAIELTAQAMAGGPANLVGAPFRRVAIQDIIPYGPAGGLGGHVATLALDLV